MMKATKKYRRGFIDYMIKKEFERFEKTFPETIFNVEQQINITQKVKEKLNEVIFSQLLPFISNMMDFGIDKRLVLKVADEFKEKYNYMNQNNLDTLYGLICSNKEELDICFNGDGDLSKLAFKLDKNFDESNNENYKEFEEEYSKFKNKELLKLKTQLYKSYESLYQVIKILKDLYDDLMKIT